MPKELNLKDHVETIIENPVNLAAVKKILDPEKLKILQHPAKKKVVVGAKDNGKTFMVKVWELLLMELYRKANTFDFRKYKDQASSKLGGYFSYAINYLQASGYTFQKNFRKSYNKYYKLHHNFDNDKNQYQEYSSLEDTNSVDGSAPANGGFYALAHIDEPIVKKDMLQPHKIPTRKDWDATELIIIDNLERFNESYEELHPDEKIPTFQLFYTMNDWGKHPLSLDAQKYFPREDFIKWIFGYELDELIGNTELLDKLFEDTNFLNRVVANNTKSLYHAETDTLYSRLTKFAKPSNRKPKKAFVLLKKIKFALETNNSVLLVTTLGLGWDGDVESADLSYNIQTFNNKTPEEMVAEGFHIKKLTYSIDIDTSRVFTLTPKFTFEKTIKFGDREIKMKRFLIDRQAELKAYGVGKYGEKHDLYTKYLSKMISAHFNHWTPLYPKQRMYIAVDDKRKHYIKYLKEHILMKPYKKTFDTFKQHGALEIDGRQDLIEIGFNSGYIYNHPANKALEEDFNNCLRRSQNDSRRITAGDTNYLDRIDSAEGGFTFEWSALANIKEKHKITTSHK